MSTRKMKLIAATVAALSAAAFGPAAADARKVNTGSGSQVTTTATVTGGTVRVKTTSFDLGALNPKITLTGTVEDDGDWTVPVNGINFPPLTIPDVSPVGDVTVRFQPTHPWTGHINPLTGVANMRMRFRIKAEGGSGLTGLGGSCYIGSTGSPVDVNTAITGTTSPPGPNTPITGTPYNPGNGQMKLVNNSVSVPGASGCGAVVGIDGQVNDALGLPSGAGNNEAHFQIQFNPILTKGIDAAITSSSFGGFAPLAVTLNAGASVAKAGSNYRFDLDGNGTWDTAASTSPTTTTTYGAGSRKPKVLVTDGDGDTSTATLAQDIVVTDRPDVKITKTTSGDFRAGNVVGYKLNVKNEGPGATTGLTTVTDVLPVGVQYQGASGTSWTCNAVLQTVTCTYPAGLASNASAPELTLNTKIALNAPNSLTNTASVATPNESGPADTDTATESVTYIDLGITKSHTGNFRPNRNGKYTLLVENLGDHATVGTTTVTDVLPDGLGWVSDVPPAGWDCNLSGQTFTCSTTDPIAPGDEDEIELTVQPDNRNWTVPVTNTATVTTTDDVDTLNNTSSDLTPVISQPDLILSKTHTGDFRVHTNGIYKLAVTNDGALDSSGAITVTDTLPAGLEFVSAAGTGWTCGAVAQVVTCERSDALAPDQTTPQITLEVDVNEDAAATVVNSAEVANASDIVPTNNAALDPTTVKRVDLSIEKRAVGGFRVDDIATYVLDVHNEGTANTFAPTTVTDTLPASLSYDSASGPGWNCSASGQVVTCTRNAAILAGADAGDIELNVLVDGTAVPSVDNTASVATTHDVNAANDSSTATSPVTTVDLALDKSHNGAFRVGTTRTYKLGIKNEGSFPTTGATTVTDTLPTGLTYVSASGSNWDCSAVAQVVTCSRDAGDVIAANATAPSIVLQVGVGVAAAPEVTNTATVATTGDSNTLNDTDTDPTDVVFNDLDVDVTRPVTNFRSGRPASYNVAVTNLGGAATNAASRVTATLPAGLTFDGSDAGAWDCSASTAQQVDCTHSGSIAALAAAIPGAAQVLDIDVDVAKNAPSPLATTWEVDTEGDPNTGNDTATDSAPVKTLDLAIDNAHDGEFVAGGTGRYKIEVENVSDIATESATKVTETLPAGLTYVGATGEGWTCSRSGQDFTCRLADPIAAGETTGFEVETEISSTAGSPLNTTATVANADDVNAANDSDSDSAPVISRPDVSLDIAPVVQTDGTYRVGTDGTWTLSVRNRGAAPTTGASTVTSTLPEGLTFARGTGDGWACSASGQDVTCTHATPLAARSRSDISLETGVALKAAPAVALGGQVSAAGDADPGNDKSEARVAVTMIDVQVRMAHFLNLPFVAGIGSAFSISVGNNGSAPTDGATTVRSRLPNGVAIEHVRGDGWSCSFQGQDVTCTRTASIAANDSVPDIELKVVASGSNVPKFTGSATVETSNDVNAANNSSTDDVEVKPLTVNAPGGQGELTGLTVTAGSLKVTKAGTVSLKVACAGVGTCKGTLALKGKKKVKGKVPSLGSAKFSVDGGKSKTIKVKLSRAGLKLVNASKKYAATATATLSPAVTGIKPATRGISITPFKAPKK